MTVYLVKSRPFGATFWLPPGMTRHGEIEAKLDIDVDLQPIAGSEESRSLFESIKKSFPQSGDWMSALCHKGISAILKFKPGDGVYAVFGGFPTYWVNRFGPETMTLYLSGPYLKELMKEFKEKLMMKVEIQLGKNSEINVISRESVIGDGNDGTGREFNFAEQWNLIQLRSFPFFLSPTVYSGLISISLVRIPCAVGVRKLLGSLPDANAVNRKLFEDKIQCDFFIVADNGTVIPCHKSFLASHSKVFERMLQTDCKETTEKQYKLRISEEAVNALLKFLYHSNFEDPIRSSSIAFELLQVAHEYDIELLEKAMKQMFIHADPRIQWFELDIMLELFQHCMRMNGYDDLRAKAVQVLKLRQSELRESSVLDKLFKDDPKCAKELYLQCLQ